MIWTLDESIKANLIKHLIDVRARSMNCTDNGSPFFGELEEQSNDLMSSARILNTIRKLVQGVHQARGRFIKEKQT